MRWKVGFIQLAKTSSAVGLIRSSKALPKAKLVLKKDHGHWLVVCCPSDLLQLSESWRNYYLWAVCSAGQWDAPKTATPAAGIRQQNGPSCPPPQCLAARRASNASEAEQIGLRSVASSTYSPDLSPTDCHFFRYLNNSLQAERFHNHQEAENSFPRFHQIPKQIFMLQE